MDFNLTNGTISSLTITTDKNLDSATVTGADYVIDENTITLTNLTSNLVLELTGEPSSSINKIHIGTLNTKNFYIGTLGVSKIYLGQYLVYAKGEPAEEAYFKLSDGKWLYTKDGKAFEAREATTISFTISSTSYQAEEGMTWAEWGDSEYNTKGFKAESTDYIVLPSPYASKDFVYKGSEYVLPSDVITANTAYSLKGAGAGN